MQPIYLGNDREYVKVLKYFPQNGEFEEILRADLPQEIALWRGYYLSLEKVVYGIYASEIGPIFFCQCERFPLSSKSCQIQFIDGKQEKCFVLFWEGIKKVEAKYSPIKYKDYDNWSSDEEFVDMFLRISRDLSRDLFWKYYTIEK